MSANVAMRILGKVCPRIMYNVCDVVLTPCELYFSAWFQAMSPPRLRIQRLKVEVGIRLVCRRGSSVVRNRRGSVAPRTVVLFGDDIAVYFTELGVATGFNRGCHHRHFHVISTVNVVLLAGVLKVSAVCMHYNGKRVIFSDANISNL